MSLSNFLAIWADKSRFIHVRKLCVASCISCLLCLCYQDPEIWREIRHLSELRGVTNIEKENYERCLSKSWIRLKLDSVVCHQQLARVVITRREIVSNVVRLQHNKKALLGNKQQHPIPD